jgi:hypothetical protein
MRDHDLLDSRQERISVVDFDVLLHRYLDRSEPNPKRRVDNVMILETKTHASGPVLGNFAQEDTRALLNALWNSRVQPNSAGRVRTYAVSVVSGGKLQRRRVRWWGAHVLALAGDRPENSGPGLWWNDRRTPITVAVLLSLLRFELDPSTLQPIDYRDHHYGEVAIKPLLRCLKEESA